jgi:hypothetical protein
MTFRSLLLSLAAFSTAAVSLTAVQPEINTVDVAPDQAALIPMVDNWRFDGDLPHNATLLSLQGLANRNAPQIYLQYPANWQWEIAGPLIDYLAERHEIDWQRYESGDLEAALRDFGSAAKGTVIWDKDVRSSLIVAYTISGVEDLLVINEDQIELAAKHGLDTVIDLRGQFTGQDDAEIYQWAFDEYYDRCSRDFYVVLGGEYGKIMKPGIADFGVQQRAFFSDLSANPKHPRQLALLNRVLAGQNPASVVLGWHSYGKDTEGQHTTLTGNYGLKMEGLHNLPNVSFTSQIPLTPDFEYSNNHTIEPDAELVAEDKVYIAALATDSMGIGAWTKPGRGRIPYGWQVLMNWSWMNPPALQYFFESKTPNDYFVAGLSGPGYMYPKSIPVEKFPGLMADARPLMEKLDLRIMEIMDYSEGNRHVGNTDLTEEYVDLYYEAFPDVLGFINGYGTARTFDLRDGVPMISYDYYLGVYRPTEEAAADLEELIRLNPQRPYFLLMHVRERTTIEQVANILDNLNDDVEVVPLDRFMKLAASKKTYGTRYQQPEDPIDHNP